MKSGYAIVVLLAGCPGAAYVPPKRTVVLQHPSAAGNVPPNVIADGVTGVSVSLTTVTNEQICVDAFLTRTGLNDAKAIAKFGKVLGSKQYAIGPCKTRSDRFPEYCANAEPYPITQTFAPVVVKVEMSKHASVSNVKTGNRESVCVEELTNKYNNTVGCARYVDQDETEEVWNEGLVHHARGGWRTCFKNDGQIGPTTTTFDIAVGVSPHRFQFTEGRAVTGAWGGSGGTSAESSPSTADPAPGPAPANRPVPAPVANGSKVPPRATPGPAPVAAKPAPDPLRAKAGTLELSAVEIKRDGKTMIAVDRTGAVQNRGQAIATWKDGVYEGRDGSAIYVITATGELWMNASPPKRVGRVTGDRLVLEDGGALSIDATNRYQMTRGGKVEVSTETVSFTRSGRRLALVMGYLGSGVIRFRKAKP